MDICMHMYMDLRMDMCVDTCEDMCIDMCIGARLSRQEIRDECYILFLAGHETTALTLQW